jgi:hypothetical protein
MKRLLAILAFLAGGLAAEITHPVYCSLVHAGRLHTKKRR